MRVTPRPLFSLQDINDKLFLGESVQVVGHVLKRPVGHQLDLLHALDQVLGLLDGQPRDVPAQGEREVVAQVGEVGLYWLPERHSFITYTIYRHHKWGL